MRLGVKKSQVYLVMASADYEGSTPVQAFMEEADAKEFVAQCAVHYRKKPKPPATIEDTPENDAEHEAHQEKWRRWAKRHPAGIDFATYASFEIIGIPLNVKKN